MFRRAVGSLLARRFSPGVNPRTAPARSLRSLCFSSRSTQRDLAIVAAGKLNHKVKFKKPDMKERFERWIIANGKTYRDEEEKAMRFELFKASLESVESQLPLVEESGVLPGVSCFADFTDEETRELLAFPDGIDETDYDEIIKSAWAKQEKGLFHSLNSRL
ncbi:uncharacterized protein [Triticum aestivum]|uniref:uncharacterized protein isoform X2 n=1 Tax=Triticum aestivum TaxID=4565 RepID=UPI001D020489|nr:uncharacterized protein LOC123170845 isoform X2 [Triticum aestivum]